MQSCCLCLSGWAIFFERRKKPRKLIGVNNWVIKSECCAPTQHTKLISRVTVTLPAAWCVMGVHVSFNVFLAQDQMEMKYVRHVLAHFVTLGGALFTNSEISDVCYGTKLSNIFWQVIVHRRRNLAFRPFSWLSLLVSPEQIVVSVSSLYALIGIVYKAQGTSRWLTLYSAGDESTSVITQPAANHSVWYPVSSLDAAISHCNRLRRPNWDLNWKESFAKKGQMHSSLQVKAGSFMHWNSLVTVSLCEQTTSYIHMKMWAVGNVDITASCDAESLADFDNSSLSFDIITMKLHRFDIVSWASLRFSAGIVFVPWSEVIPGEGSHSSVIPLLEMGYSCLSYQYKWTPRPAG